MLDSHLRGKPRSWEQKRSIKENMLDTAAIGRQKKIPWLRLYRLVTLMVFGDLPTILDLSFVEDKDVQLLVRWK